MSEYILLLAAVTPVFLLMFLGFGLRRTGLLTREADNAFLRVNFNVFYPCLIFHSVLGNRALEDTRNLVAAPLLGFGIIVAGFGICYLAARFCGVAPGVDRRTFAFTVAIPNYGYLPIPLIGALFDAEVLAVLFLFNLGVEVALWTVGVLLLSGSGGGAQAWRKVINGPSITVVVALLCNAVGLKELPQALDQLVIMLGACSIPVGLLMIGAVMSDLAHQLDFVRNWHPAVGACLLRMGVLSAATFAVAKYLPGTTVELQQVLLLQGSMPCAVVPVVMARLYRASEGMAIQVVFATTAIGLFLIPLLIKLGRWYIGI